MEIIDIAEKCLEEEYTVSIIWMDKMEVFISSSCSSTYCITNWAGWRTILFHPKETIDQSAKHSIDRGTTDSRLWGTIEVIQGFNVCFEAGERWCKTFIWFVWVSVSVFERFKDSTNGHQLIRANNVVVSSQLIPACTEHKKGEKHISFFPASLEFHSYHPSWVFQQWSSIPWLYMYI